MTAGSLLAFTHVYEPAQQIGAPTLLLLHGTGGDEHDLLPLAQQLVPNAGVLSPRGRVSEHGMPRFFRRLAPGVFDAADLALRTQELRDFIDAAATHYGFPRDRVIAVGLSNGANIAAHLLLAHGPVLRGAVLFRAMPVSDEPPVSLSGDVHVYMNSGRRDRMISAEVAGQLAQRLRAAGADVTLEWDDAGHELTRPAIDAARQWLQTRLQTRLQT